MGGRWMSCHSETSALQCPPNTQEVTQVIRAGDTLVNPVSGETITFVETAAETGGDYTVIECAVRPGGGVPMAHVHPNQSETFEVLDGELGKRGMPHPLQLAVIARATFGDARAPYVPAWMQKAGLSVGAAIGRLAGYAPTYEPAPASAAAPAAQREPATA
jgi:hypothetical protein